MVARMLIGLICIQAAGCGSKPDTKLTLPNPGSVRVDGDLRDGEDADSLTGDRNSLIRRSDQLMRNGEFDDASKVLRELLLAQPSDVETLFRYANAVAAKGDLSEAVSILDSIPTDHPNAGLAAIGQAADWRFQLERYDEAEASYLKVLQLAPKASVAHRQLAYLLNRQGRRHEAAIHIQELCRLGDVREDEVRVLMSLSDAVFDDPKDSAVPDSESRPYWPIGPVGEARRFFSERRYVDAVNLLQQYIHTKPLLPSVNAFYGRCLAEAQDEKNLVGWLANADAATKDYSEYWAALGAYLIEQQRFEESVRALGEAILRDPTDARSLRRINQAFVALGKDDDAKRWFDRSVILRDTTLCCNRISENKAAALTAFPELIAGLIKLGRPLEAVIWQVVELYYRKADRSEIARLNDQRLLLAGSATAFGNRKEILCGTNLDLYPLPELKHIESSVPSTSIATSLSIDSLSQPCFENVSAGVGLNHAYRVAAMPTAKGFSIYQSVGGGVAVFDYDLDGFDDLYFAQGGSDPPLFQGDQSNVLYRTLSGKLHDVTNLSQSTENRYSIGVTAGDWNQDGFQDLIAANVGPNTLFINNGDGTFSATATDGVNETNIMSTSIAVADVTGDSLPDIVELNYADDADLARKPSTNARGEIEVVTPLSFKPGMDRVLVNDGKGGRIPQNINDSESAKSTGLGVIIADFDGIPGTEIFVGNDVRPDQLWKRNDDGSRTDIAALTGCALSAGGGTTASMGIAAADFDRTGTLDMYITNFQNEASTLLLNRGSTFQDRSIQFKLAEDSYSVLGFGCQPIDYSNDGNIDLLVTNGHVDDTGTIGQPFEQPAQLFANLGMQYRLLSVADQSHYFDTNHVGRALARLDFNHDGKTDVVITHLEAPSALILNRTATNNHWLKIFLVGTQCERDAIGAKIQVQIGEQLWTDWVIAGDGYLCRNESQVTFGLGNETVVDQLTVTWPDGKTQTFQNVAVDQSVIAIEGDIALFSTVY